MSIFPAFCRYLDDRSDLPEEERSRAREALRPHLERSHNLSQLELQRAEVDPLLPLVGDFRRLAFQYMERGDYFSDPPIDAIEQNLEVRAIEDLPTDYFKTFFRFLFRDRAEALIQEALERKVSFEFDDATHLKDQTESGFRFWMPREEDLQARGVPKEASDRFRGDDGLIPPLLLVNGLSSSMSLPVLRLIRSVFNGLGIPVGAVECKFTPSPDGNHHIHSLTERLDFLRHIVERILESHYRYPKMVLVGHSMGGTVCHDFMQEGAPADQSMLIRVGTPAPSSDHFVETFVRDDAIFAATERPILPMHRAALQPPLLRPNGSPTLRDAKEVYLFHRRDILVWDQLFRDVERDLGLVLTVGAPFPPDGISSNLQRRAEVIRAELIRRRAEDGVPSYIARLKEVLGPHNFSNPSDAQVAVRLLVSVIAPFLFKERVLGEHVGYNAFTKNPALGALSGASVFAS